ncbi:MAG: tetratricopeptide repeat protein [Bacteroidales bacterium]|nr:tetratricopeptide repeat protein [Bacteroidales bacterium]
MTLLALLLLTSCSLFHSAVDKEEKEEVTLDYQDSLAVTAKFIEGKKEALIGNNDKAIETYSEVLGKSPNHDAALFEMARMYSNLREFKSALVFAERAAKVDTGNIWYRKLLVDLYQRTGNLEQSRKQLRWLINTVDNNVTFYRDLYQVERYMGNYEDALETLDKIESIAGTTEKSLQRRIRILQEIEDYEKAAKYALELLEKDQTNPDYYRELIALYNKADKPKKALEIIQNFKESEKDEGWADLMLAKQYRKIGDKEASFQHLRQAVGNKELTIDAKVEVLMSYYSNPSRSDSLKKQEDILLEELLKAHPKNPIAHSLMGDFYLKNNQNEKALASFEKVLEMDSTRYPVWEQILKLNFQQGKYEKTKHYAERAIELFPGKPILYFLKGNAHSRLSEPQKAIKTLENGLYFISNKNLKMDFYASLGDQYNKIENYKASDNAFERALNIDPENTYVLNNYAYFLSVRGEKLSKAYKMSKKVVEKHPENATYLDTHGWVLFQQEKYEEALKYLDKALKNASNKSSEILEHYGDCLYMTGEKDKALQYWKKAYKKNKSLDRLKKKIDKETINP